MIRLYPSFVMAAALASTAQCFAGGAVPVFDLPLGGSLKSVKVCGPLTASPVETACWLSAPKTASGGRKYGSILVPEASLPAWAAYSTIEVSTDKAGALVSISVETKNAQNISEIAQSVGARFGQPTEQHVAGTRIPIVRWRLPTIDILVQQFDGDCCKLRFETPDEAAARQRELDDRAAMESRRPATP